MSLFCGPENHVKHAPNPHNLICRDKSILQVQWVPRKGFGSADGDTMYIYIYPSVHNQPIRTFFEAYIVKKENIFFFTFYRPGGGRARNMYFNITIHVMYAMFELFFFTILVREKI